MILIPKDRTEKIENPTVQFSGPDAVLFAMFMKKEYLKKLFDKR